jgi:hypothetical protein
MVAKAAGVAPPTEIDKEQFIRSLPSRFASMPTEKKQDLREAEIRLAQFHIVYDDGTIKTHAAVLADIRNSNPTPPDIRSADRNVHWLLPPAVLLTGSRIPFAISMIFWRIVS